jgi:hypothetical protein
MTFAEISVGVVKAMVPVPGQRHEKICRRMGRVPQNTIHGRCEAGIQRMMPNFVQLAANF